MTLVSSGLLVSHTALTVESSAIGGRALIESFKAELPSSFSAGARASLNEKSETPGLCECERERGARACASVWRALHGAGVGRMCSQTLYPLARHCTIAVRRRCLSGFVVIVILETRHLTTIMPVMMMMMMMMVVCGGDL